MKQTRSDASACACQEHGERDYMCARGLMRQRAHKVQKDMIQRYKQTEGKLDMDTKYDHISDQSSQIYCKGEKPLWSANSHTQVYHVREKKTVVSVS